MPTTSTDPYGYRSAEFKDFVNPKGAIYHTGCGGEIQGYGSGITHCARCFSQWTEERLSKMDVVLFKSTFHFKPYPDRDGVSVVWKQDQFGRFYTSAIPTYDVGNFEKVKV